MFDSGTLRKLKLPVYFTLGLLIAISGYYLYRIRSQASYLNSSNLRLLTTIGRHIEDWVDRQQRIFGIVIEKPDPKAFIATWDADPRLWTFADRPGPAMPNEVEQPTLSRDSRGRLWLELASKWGDRRRVQFEEHLLEPLGAALQKDVFDVVLLSSPKGMALARAGDEDIYVADLDMLVGQGAFAKLASLTAYVPVKLSGSDYKLFVQPCCRELRLRGMDIEPPASPSVQPTPGKEDSRDTKSAAGTEAEKKAATTEDAVKLPAADRRFETGLVVAGLVSNATLTERRLSVSFTTMVISAGLLLMLVVSWPFIKLALIGTRQRVALLDVLLLGISSLLVLLLGTLYLLDVYAYGRLRSHTDERLRALSADVRSNMRKEIAAAYSQLRALEAAARDRSEPESGGVVDVDVLPRHPTPDFSFYPFFESFSLIDRKGTQRVKWSIRARSAPLISVKDRNYFKRVIDNDTWSLPAEGAMPAIQGIVLDSNRSITRMEPQAVLATAAHPPSKDSSVAALAFPMISLINSVLAPGFGFAVIEDSGNGRVLFHSEEARNTLERFFPETDFDRRLRSAVAARRAELLDIQYWGRDYRAYVAPVAGLPWSLVSFYDKELIRSVNVDLIVTTLLFMVAYALGYVAACIFVLLRPGNRATWLWPLPGGLSTYLQLSGIYLVLIVIVGIAIYSGDSRSAVRAIIIPVLVAPPLAWAVTYLLLRIKRRPVAPADRTGKEPAGDVPGFPNPQPNTLLPLAYICAATLLLVITAVLPTVASFKLAHSVQVTPFLKYTQLRLAAGLAERRRRAEGDPGKLSDAARRVDLEVEPPSSSSGPQTMALKSLSPTGSPCRGYSPGIVSRRSTVGCPQLQFTDGDEHKRPILPVDIHFADSSSNRGYIAAFAAAESEDSHDRPRFGTALTLTSHLARRRPPYRSGAGFVELLEPYLPYYSESSVAMRELLHDEADDNTHWWDRDSSGRLILTNADYGKDILTISSVVPSFGTFRGLFLVFVLVGGLVIWIAVFIARRVFLMDMPLWSPAAGGFTTAAQSKFVVCRRRAARETYLAGLRHAKIDLATQNDWSAALTELDQVPPGETILVDHFEHGVGDRQLNEKKLWLIEELVQVRRRNLIVLSTIGPAPLLREALASESTPKGSESPTVEQRWAALLTCFFVVTDLDTRFETDADAASNAPGPVTRWEKALGTKWRWRFRFLPAYLQTRQHRAVRNALDREYAGNPYLLPIYDDVSRLITRRGEQGFDREELLEEFGARAASYYEGLWACCSPVEKLVLEHLGEEGFANYKDGKAVRRLISRGLIRRDPHLRVMNETFRRFVISTRCRKEVGEVEKRTMKSAWDHFQRPFMIALAIALVLFVATQRQRFDSAMTLVVGLTGIIPSLLKLAGFLLGEKQMPSITTN